MVERTRVPSADLPRFWTDLECRYKPHWPRFRVGSRDTSGLTEWLARAGYRCERTETVMVLDLPMPRGFVEEQARTVHEVDTPTGLNQIIHLDHLVFKDPILDADGLAQELKRLGNDRRLFFIPGVGDLAWAAGGISLFPRWALLWGGETHPDYRHQGFYRQVLKARLQILHPEKTEFVAVIADDSTSMPILDKIGFRAIGQATVWAPHEHP